MGTIEEEIRITGGKQAKQELDEVAGSTENLGKKTEESGDGAKKADRSFTELIGTYGVGVAAIGSMVGSLIGAGGLLAALNENSEAAKKLKADLEGVIDAMTSTIALTGDPRFVEAAKQVAIESGRDLKEVGAAAFPIVSGTSGASVDEQIDILRQAGELAKTEPATPLESFANALIGLRGATGGKLSPQQLQNLAVSTADLAVTDFAKLSNTLPAVLGVAGPSGATVPEAAAIFAQLTAPLGPAETSTAAKNILSRFAAPSDTGRKVLSARGVPEGATPFEALQILAASGQLSALEIRDLLGEGPAAAGLPALLEGIDKVDSDRALIASSLEPGAPDLGTSKIETLRNRLPGFEPLEQERRLRQQIEAKKRERDGVLQTATVRAAFEKALVDQGFSPATVKSVLEGKLGGFIPGFDQLIGLGLSPGSAVGLAAPLEFNQEEPTSLTGAGPLAAPIAVVDALSNFFSRRTAGIEDIFQTAAPNTFPRDARVTVINNTTNIGTNYSGTEPGTVSPTPPEVGD